MFKNLYPGAKQHPLIDHSNPGTLQDKNQIIPHITQGPTAMSAIWTFEGSRRPNRLSVHFVIDRDGTVYQLLDPSDIGFHASQVNTHAIGIEHAAIAGTLMATDAQYRESAKLLVWLSNLIGTPLDRHHIRTHNEASPADHHTLCCTGAMDPDRLVSEAVQLVVSQKEIEDGK